MSEYDLYVQRVAANGVTGVRATEAEFQLAPDLVERHGEQPLREGLAAFRCLLVRLYTDMGERPALYGIPPVPDSKVRHTPSRRKVRGPFEEPLKLLYALGLAGTLEPGEGGLDLVCPRPVLDELARALTVHDLPAAVAGLALAGLAAEETGAGVALRASDHGSLPLALKVFADTCRLWERGKLKVRQMPHVWLLADFRILRRTDARAKLPKMTLREALPFVPRERVAELCSLCEHLESLGYRAHLDYANLLDGEVLATYVGVRHGRTIFGFTACRGGLSLRPSFRDIGRMGPDIDACPPALRRGLYSLRCGHCGGAGCGRSLKVTVDGAEVEICYFGIQRLAEWEPADIAHLKRLLTVQDRLYREAGGGRPGD